MNETSIKIVFFLSYITAIVAHNDRMFVANSAFARSATRFCFSILFWVTNFTSALGIKFNSLYWRHIIPIKFQNASYTQFYVLAQTCNQQVYTIQEKGNEMLCFGVYFVAKSFILLLFRFYFIYCSIYYYI